MVLHASRSRVLSLAHALGRQFHYVDELDILNSHAHADSHALKPSMDRLPPLAEEVCNSVTAATETEPPLAAQVLITFHDAAVRSVYTTTYVSSQSFVPTDRICRGLLRRIRHCCAELITRKDPDALDATQCILKGPKQLRFELAFEINRNGSAAPWAKTSFQSYQKHALTSASAMDILRSTHFIIAMFLRRHDAEYNWTQEPASHCFPGKPETLELPYFQSLDLQCVPTELTKDAFRACTFTPGYSLEFTLRTKAHTAHKMIIRSVKVDSVQASPLTLDSSEDLLWQAYMFLQGALEDRKSQAPEHGVCNDEQCDKTAVDLELRVHNNLGPTYEHLHRTLQSNLKYIGHSESQYFEDFFADIQARFQIFRDEVDVGLLQLHDFDFRIAELKGHGWRESNCARFVIDGRQGHGRRSILALLDRIRTGINDVLRGHDVAIRMVAFKRGHLILDKALVARGHRRTPESNHASVGHNQQQELIARLKARIQRDIDMVCRDTCSLDDVPSGPTTPERPLRHSRSSFAPTRPRTPRSIASHRTAPGSPSSFMFHPATPPDASSSPRSSRAFPLVPVRSMERNFDADTAPDIHESPSRPGIEEGPKTVHGMLKLGPPIGLPVIDDSVAPMRLAEAISARELKPAAEVFPVSQRPEVDTDSVSTHSSLPALTISDTSSPDQSILITPNVGQATSPNAHSDPSMDSPDSHRLSASWTVQISAPNDNKFSETEDFVEPKSAVARTDSIAQRGQGPPAPVTPRLGNAELLVSAGTPKVPMDPNGNEKTPLAHRQMQGPTEPEDNKFPKDQHEFKNKYDVTKDSQAMCNPANTDNNHEYKLECTGSVAVKAETALSHSVAGTHTYVKDDQLESTRDSDMASASAKSTTPTAAEPLIVTDRDRQSVITAVKTKTRTSTDNQTSALPGSRSASQAGNAASEEIGLDLLTSPGRMLVPARIERKVSRTRLDYADQDEFGFVTHNKTRISAPTGDRNILCLHERARSVSGGPENAGHIPVVSSVVDVATGPDACEDFVSELEDKNIFSPITDTVFDFGFDNVDSVLEHMAGLGGFVWQTRPEVRQQDVCRPSNDNKSPVENIALKLCPHGPEAVQSIPNSVPTRICAADAPSQNAASAPITPSAPPQNESQPSSSQVIADDAQLLPPLPILAGLAPVYDIPQSIGPHATEDDVASGQQATDSMYMTTSSLKALTKEELKSANELHYVANLRATITTSNTSLLGLQCSRLRPFEILTALKGSHAFDGSSTVSMLERNVDELDDTDFKNTTGSSAEPDVQEETSQPKSQRRVMVLKQRSVGSTVVVNKMQHMKNNTTRESGKEQNGVFKMQDEMVKDVPKIILNGDKTFMMQGGGVFSRFSAALIVVAGLAIASTAVRRYRA